MMDKEANGNDVVGSLLEEAREAVSAVDGHEYPRILSVTPQMAEAWLNNRAKNRPIDERRVAKYADEMRAGRWQVTGQGVSIGLDGKLYDGEHRLWAVFESGETVRMLVVFNVSEEARKNTDTGKVRRSYDLLGMFTDVEDAKNVTAWANAVYRIVYDGTPALSANDHEAWYYAVADDLRFASQARQAVPSKLRRKLASATVFGALVLAHRKHPGPIAEFAAQLATGEGLTNGDPAHTLRNLLLSDQTRVAAHEVRQLGLKTLRAAQYFVEGARIVKLQSGEEGLRYFITAHSPATLPRPLVSSPQGGKLTDADRARYEAVKGETSVARIVAKLRASGLSTDEIPNWCVAFQRFVPRLLAEVPGEVDRQARDRAKGGKK